MLADKEELSFSYCSLETEFEYILKEPTAVGRTKHMDLRLKKIREWENDGYLKFEYIETENNLADLFTKPLSKKRFEELKKRIMEPDSCCHSRW